MNRLEGKVTVITGAGDSVGKQCSEVFAKEGAKVVLIDVKSNLVSNNAKALREKGYIVESFDADVANLDECKNAFDYVVEKFGTVDVLFCNIDKKGDMIHDVAHMSQQNLRDVFEANVIATWNCLHFVAPIMVKSKKGSIITRGSVNGIMCGNTGYGPMKAAINAMTVGVANELGRYGIRANCILPYYTNQEMAGHSEKYVEIVAYESPMYKLIDEIDIVNTALYLASDECLTVSGMDFWIDKGVIKGNNLNREPKSL